MVTGFESRFYEDVHVMTKALVEVAKELKVLNDRLDKWTYAGGALATVDVSKG